MCAYLFVCVCACAHACETWAWKAYWWSFNGKTHYDFATSGNKVFVLAFFFLLATMTIPNTTSVNRRPVLELVL